MESAQTGARTGTRGAGLDDLARDFLASPHGTEPFSDWSLNTRLAEFLRDRRLARLASDRDAFDLLVNRVIQFRLRRRRRVRRSGV